MGVRLRELREERGWTQRELDSRLGIMQSKLSKYESGTHQPSLRTLVRMANLFGVSTDYLLTGTGTPVPPLRDDRLLDRFRRLGASGEEMRSIVLSILDALFELGACLEQRAAGGSTAAAGPGGSAYGRAPRRKPAAVLPLPRSTRSTRSTRRGEGASRTESTPREPEFPAT
jgi:transcriptional regulator with XRE-family HTH domain